MGQDPEKYVEKLLELFNRYSALVKSGFHNDPRFLTSRDKVICVKSELIITSVKC